MECRGIMSSDTLSSVFPDRPIRPLPKRRLREKLSPEAAESIKYPPSTKDALPLFYYPPYSAKNGYGRRTISSRRLGSLQLRSPDEKPTTSHHSSGLGDTDEEDYTCSAQQLSADAFEEQNQPDASSSSLDQQRRTEPALSISTASSVDGYDSLENTNNKKKRKIPTANDSAGPHPQMNNAHSVLGAGGASYNKGDKQYHTSGSYSSTIGPVSGSHGMSTLSRSRLPHLRNGRSPLRTIPDGGNTWPMKGSRAQRGFSKGHEQGSAISAAISEISAHRQQQENTNVLREPANVNKPAPTVSQFTFTCDSGVPGTVQWPGQHARSSTMLTEGSTMSTAINTPAVVGGGLSSGRNSRRSNRRQLEKELETAARHRRQIAASNFYHSPPKFDDIWICEFCEYERIFGVPPRALIRDYEIKDRRHRQEEADRKRLLEKAKAKSRKGKKGNRLSKGHPTLTNTAPVHGDDTEPLAGKDAALMEASFSGSTDSVNDSSGDLGEESSHIYERTDANTEPILIPSKDNT